MATQSCTCADVTICPELPPVAIGSKLIVLNEANCQRALVPPPGSVLYADGSGVTWADGGATRPLALPALSTFEQPTATSIPSLLTRFAGGAIASVTPDASIDGLYLSSLAGEWVLGPLIPQLCYDPDDIINECCCPAAFAVWVEVEDQMCLRSFNPCEGATNVESGSIFSCEDGCMRKLVGTSGDQVPAWDVATQTWIPAEISDLIPTPESVLDVANVTWSWINDVTLPGTATLFNHFLGINNGYTITGSGVIATSVVNAVPYNHSVIRIENAGWHKFDFTFSGQFDSVGLATSDPSAGINTMQVLVTKNAATTSHNNSIRSPIVAYSAPNVAEFDVSLSYQFSFSFAVLCAANDLIDIQITALFGTPGGGSGGGAYNSGIFVGTFGTGATAEHNLNGTITRIT